MRPRLSAKQLHLSRHGKQVLHSVDFELSAGDLVGIVGGNGAGKSTLLKALMSLLPVERGNLSLGDQALHEWTARERAKQLAYLAQGHDAQWPLTAQAVVALGRLPHVRHAAHDANIVASVMKETGTWELRARNVQTLSGGELARVLLARALAVEAPLLLADEPLSALDPAHQLRIMQVLQTRAQQGMGIAVVMHDLLLATRYCSHLLMLHQGRVLAFGVPQAVCTPANLAQCFGIEAVPISFEGQTVHLPWRLAHAAQACALT